ncbi:allantoinase, partial [Mesorhizobium sp. M2C.T.Ca.TU.009.01.2.1]
MTSLDLLIRAPRAILPEGERAVSVGAVGGKIVRVAALDAPDNARETVTLDADTVLLPGLVDSHVHICEPGNTGWEGFLTATRAAAAGGITTLVDMPLDSVPTTVTLEAFAAKREAAAGQCHVDVGFWGGAIPSNLED